MQYLIQLNHKKEEQMLLELLERLKISYQAVPEKQKNNAVPVSFVDQFNGKLASETAEALLRHVEQSRNEWE